MIPARDVQKLVKDLRRPADTRTHDRIVGHLLDVLRQVKPQTAAQQPATRRTIMGSPIVKLAAAAGLILAVVLPATLLVKSTPTASAAVILQQAAEAMEKLKSFHIKVEMRTLPGDNFSLIRLDLDFVPIDFWKQFTNELWGKWRLEEPGRVVVMDGRLSSMFYKYLNTVHEVEDPDPERYWTECLVELDKVMVREARNASEHPAEFTSSRQRGADGREKVIVSVEVPSKVPETDYSRDKSIKNSDHLKIYQFDAESKLLENTEIYVHHKGRDVLVFRLVEAEYNVEFEPALFTLDLPADVIRTVLLQILPDNERYEKMTPKEAATVFFTAWANGDWDEILKFKGQTGVPQVMKDYYGGLTVIEIGEPFQSAGSNERWYVPFKIKLKSGEVVDHKLALVKDESIKRFRYDGGM
jgi:outer membrane lipoprotein-sorting protein